MRAMVLVDLPMIWCILHWLFLKNLPDCFWGMVRSSVPSSASFNYWGTHIWCGQNSEQLLMRSYCPFSYYCFLICEFWLQCNVIMICVLSSDYTALLLWMEFWVLTTLQCYYDLWCKLCPSYWYPWTSSCGTLCSHQPSWSFKGRFCDGLFTL